MKLIAFSALFLVISSAQAFVSLHCSNATGSVIWEEGDNQNLARLTYDGFVTGILEVDRRKLQIERTEEVTLRDQLLSQCGANSTMTTFAARVLITPAASHPDILLSYFQDNQIEADVICEKITSSLANCRP